MSDSRPALLVSRSWMNENDDTCSLLEGFFSIQSFNLLDPNQSIQSLLGVTITVALVRLELLDVLAPFVRQLEKKGFSIEHVVAINARSSEKFINQLGLCDCLEVNADDTTILDTLSGCARQCLHHPTTPPFSERRDLMLSAIRAGTVDETDMMILGMLVNGDPDEEIAQTLHFSNQTIRNRVSDLLHNVKVANRTQLANAWRNFCYQREFT